MKAKSKIELGRPEFMIGAHCLNHNAHSIGICYEGGLDIRGQPADTRTPEQKAALRALLKDLHRRYPQALIVGHHDLNPQKACPCIENVAREERCSSLLTLDKVNKLTLCSLNRSLDSLSKENPRDHQRPRGFIYFF